MLNVTFVVRDYYDSLTCEKTRYNFFWVDF